MQTDDYGYITEMTLDEAMAMITESRMVAARGNGKSILEHNRSMAWITIVNAIYENKRFREKSHMSEIVIKRPKDFNYLMDVKWTCTNCGREVKHTMSNKYTDEEAREIVHNTADKFCRHCGARLKEDGDGR
jgi:DNA-directed RNA polymerase subunit RPC12/RpoP